MNKFACKLFGIRTPKPLPLGASIAGHTENLSETFTPSKYYEYLRKEIEREDTITNHRLTWSMTFQGFLIASMTFLLSSSWSGQPPEIEWFRKLAVGAVGCVGLAAACLTIIGVDASRNAIDQVISDWEAMESDEKLKIIPRFAPRTYGPEDHDAGGRLYARAIPRIFVLAWAFYVIAYAVIIVLPALSKKSIPPAPAATLSHSSSTNFHFSYSWARDGD